MSHVSFDSLNSWATAILADGPLTNLSSEWAGSKGSDPASDIRTGTSGSLPEITQAFTNLDSGDVLGFQTTYDVSGDYVDVALYLSGEPECMVSQPFVPQPKPLVHVVVDMLVSSSINKKEIHKRGVAVMAAIEAARVRGYSVRVSLVGIVQGTDGQMHRQWVEVADSRFAYNPEVVHYAISSPHILRCWWLASGSLHGVQDNVLGYGRIPIKYTEEDLQFIGDNSPTEKQVIVESLTSESDLFEEASPEGWLDRIQEVL